MHLILVVEDSFESYSLVQKSLVDHQLHWAKSVSEAAELLRSRSFDLILLDVLLPDGDGYGLCSLLQNDDQTRVIPKIFLTSQNSTADRVFGFSVGADDYMAKPFERLELKARVEAKLRRRDDSRRQANISKFGKIEINKTTQKVSVSKDGVNHDIELTPLEFKMLVFLSSQPGRVFSRDEILDTLWGASVHVYSRSVDTHISKLRKKLGSAHTCIASTHGAGYQFVLPDVAVRKVLSSPADLQMGALHH